MSSPEPYTSSTSSSNGTSSSFHTASETERHKSSSEDEIHTFIGSSEASEISSIILGHRSRSDDTITSYRSDSFITEGEETKSSYSTAQSSFDSRSKSETYFTATSRSDPYSQTQSRSSFYTDEFISEDPSSTSKGDFTLEPDLADSTDIQRLFIKSRLRLLKVARRDHPQTEPDKPEVDEEVEEKQNKFVNERLSVLQLSRWTGHSKIPLAPQQKFDSRFSDVTVPRGLVDKLRIENLLHSMKRIFEEPVHEPDKCASCRRKQSAVKENDFATEKRRLVYNRLTEEKYQHHMITNDPVSEIGRLAGELPKLSDDPNKIWDKLLQKGIT